jgi:L-fucose mutarotase/ribose pyranase (RbsD/FucU family)
MSRRDTFVDKKLQVYAVIRIDRDFSSPEVAVAVKEILPGEKEASAEVERLNRLNFAKGCKYFWQATRYFPNGRKAIDKRRTPLKLVKARH